MKQGGDDLEDDFVYDDTVALSGDEDEPPIALLDEEDVFLDAADEDDREDDDDEADAKENDTSASAAAKKRKRREKDKERKAKVCLFHFLRHFC